MTTPPSQFDAVLRGTWCILPTPFDATGALDPASLATLVDAAIGWGVDGLTADGRHGRARQPQPGRARGGAAAAMVASPPLLRNVDLLPGFYRAVAEGTGLPIIVQDEPAATGVIVPVSVLLACLTASGARTVKLEDPPTPPKIGRLLAADPGLAVFGGLGGASTLWELERGACGTMTGFAYPEILRAIRLAIESGDRDRAGRMFDRYLPLIAYEAQPVVGVAIRKELLRRRGAIRHAGTRGLGGPLDGATLDALDVILDRLAIVPAIVPLIPAVPA
jgi:4-hydroxy-tetrahydrodipicolinate synthase